MIRQILLDLDVCLKVGQNCQTFWLMSAFRICLLAVVVYHEHVANFIVKDEFEVLKMIVVRK